MRSARSSSSDARFFALPRLVAALGLVAWGVGCAPLEPGEESLGTQQAELARANGLTANGLMANGLSTNGLSTNGLSTNGLSTNGLLMNGFSTWFNANDVGYSDMMMKYLVACAVPAGESRTWTNPATGVSYTWNGGLGLAPGWAGGAPATEPEQQLISACLAAHVNKYGMQVQVSMRGEDAQGRAIPVSVTEALDFREKEGAFFGNLFTGEGVYSASERELRKDESTARACGLSSQDVGMSSECPPIVHAGSTAERCTWSTTRGYYTSCTYNGKAYRPITVRLRSQDIYRCGDGVCQFTEKCGDGHTYNNCRQDCGAC